MLFNYDLAEVFGVKVAASGCGNLITNLVEG